MLSNAVLNRQVDAVAGMLNGGSLLIYGDQLLARLTFSTPAFRPAADGMALAYPIAPEQAARRGVGTRYECVAVSGDVVISDVVGPDFAVTNPIRDEMRVECLAFTLRGRNG